MKIEKIFATGIIILSILANVTAQKIGEKLYKEISINGEQIGKWCEYTSLTEYDESGNVIYSKGATWEYSKEYDVNGKIISDSTGSIWKYDSKGNNIYFKNPTRGFEIYYDYDSKGNMIHYKRTDGVENWYDYDASNNQTHQKTSIGNDLYWEYDKNGNKIHEKWIIDGKILRSEITWSYNNQNKPINRKEIKYDKETIDSTSEDSYKYDSVGNLSYEKNIYKNKYGEFITEQNYIYDVYNNLLYRFYEKGNYSFLDYHELEYWDFDNGKVKRDLTFRGDGIKFKNQDNQSKTDNNISIKSDVPVSFKAEKTDTLYDVVLADIVDALNKNGKSKNGDKFFENLKAIEISSKKSNNYVKLEELNRNKNLPDNAYVYILYELDSLRKQGNVSKYALSALENYCKLYYNIPTNFKIANGMSNVQLANIINTLPYKGL